MTFIYVFKGNNIQPQPEQPRRHPEQPYDPFANWMDQQLRAVVMKNYETIHAAEVYLNELRGATDRMNAELVKRSIVRIERRIHHTE